MGGGRPRENLTVFRHRSRRDAEVVKDFVGSVRAFMQVFCWHRPQGVYRARCRVKSSRRAEKSVMVFFLCSMLGAGIFASVFEASVSCSYGAGARAYKYLVAVFFFLWEFSRVFFEASASCSYGVEARASTQRPAEI